MVYINDFYADNAVLYQFVEDPKLLAEKLNPDLLNVDKWLHNNKLTLNVEKTRLINSNKRLSGIVSFFLSIFESNVINVPSFKYLGIKFSANFTWIDHIEYISSIINKNLSLLRRIKHLLPLHTHILFL